MFKAMALLTRWIALHEKGRMAMEAMMKQIQDVVRLANVNQIRTGVVYAVMLRFVVCW